MKRTLGLLLLLATIASADKTPAEFRLKKDPDASMRGWILEYDDDGFLFQAFGNKKRLQIRWDDLVAEDAKNMRIGFELELTEDEKLGLIDGHEIIFKGGGEVVGILLGVEEDGTHRVRVEGLVLPYPRDRIERVIETKIKESEAYSPEEVYIHRLQRRPPRTAGEHRRLADYLYDIGNFEGAQEQYQNAIAKDPGLGPVLEDRMAELKDYMTDKAAALAFREAKRMANLDGKYSAAMDLVQRYIDEHPGARRRGARLISEIEDRWIEKKKARFHHVKNEEFDRAVRRYLVTRKPDMAEARSWATNELPDEVKRRVARRLVLSGEDMEMFLESKAKGSPHWASYWTGSFVISKRASTGKSTRRKIRGDPEAWWDKFQDVSVRKNWLKAYAAERLDLFEVVQINSHPCDRCGGGGNVSKWSPTALADGRHEWKETCPRCFGSGEDRGVGYR